MSCLPRLTTNVSCGFTLVLEVSKGFAFSKSKGGHLRSKGGANAPSPAPPPNETLINTKVNIGSCCNACVQ